MAYSTLMSNLDVQISIFIAGFLIYYSKCWICNFGCEIFPQFLLFFVQVFVSLCAGYHNILLCAGFYSCAGFSLCAGLWGGREGEMHTHIFVLKQL